MSESSSPVLIEKPTAIRFAKRAAMFSVLAPLIVCLFDTLVHPHIHGIVLIKIAIWLLLSVSSLIFGIAALAATKQHGRKGI
jgi:hypothetical protein